jgi:Transcription-initiator DNA-binding domain IBD.
MKKRFVQILGTSMISLCCALFFANIKAVGPGPISADTQRNLDNLSQFIKATTERHKKNHAIEQFKNNLNAISGFIKGVKDENERIAVGLEIGYLEIGDVILINNTKLREFMGKLLCKSSINGYFQKLNYQNNHLSETAVRELVRNKISQLDEEKQDKYLCFFNNLINNNFELCRQLTVRCPIQNTNAPNSNIGVPAVAPVGSAIVLPPVQNKDTSNLNLGVHAGAPVGDNIGVLVQNANVPNFNLGAPAENHINEQLQELPKNILPIIDPDPNNPDLALWGSPFGADSPDDIWK